MNEEYVAINVGKMPWKNLLTLASKYGVLRRGMDHESVVRAARKAMRESWELED